MVRERVSWLYRRCAQFELVDISVIQRRNYTAAEVEEARPPYVIASIRLVSVPIIVFFERVCSIDDIEYRITPCSRTVQYWHGAKYSWRYTQNSIIGVLVLIVDIVNGWYISSICLTIVVGLFFVLLRSTFARLEYRYSTRVWNLMRDIEVTN